MSRHLGKVLRWASPREVLVELVDGRRVTALLPPQARKGSEVVVDLDEESPRIVEVAAAGKTVCVLEDSR